ncbi:MAG: uroporphyrinogen-III synthase [Burkholderiales bacterium]|nr:uroporphyrinogen-III synthase [Burkholderiales bacterium]
MVDSPTEAPSAPPLAGRGVVVTRPREQAGRLSALLKAAAARPILFPTLEIDDPLDSRALRTAIDRLDSFDVAIFISPTAASRGMQSIGARRSLPARLEIAAIGKGTARELHRLGVEDVVAPATGADSEALLALPRFADMHARSVVIFRGAGGRELLGETLAQRGATVEYAECYRRKRPSGDAQMLLRAWGRGEVHAVTVTSREALANLVDMVGTLGRHWLRKTPLFVPHERIAQAARALGIADVLVTAPGDEAMVAAIASYFAASP